MRWIGCFALCVSGAVGCGSDDVPAGGSESTGSTGPGSTGVTETTGDTSSGSVDTTSGSTSFDTTSGSTSDNTTIDGNSSSSADGSSSGGSSTSDAASSSTDTSGTTDAASSSTDTSGTTDGGSSSSGEPLSDYELDIQPIWDESCSFGVAGTACHSPGGQWATLDLTPGESYNSLMNGDPLETVQPYVEPGDPDGSYLWHKIMDTWQGAPSNGVCCAMPLPDAGMDPGLLPAADLDLIEQWILDGALP